MFFLLGLSSSTRFRIRRLKVSQTSCPPPAPNVGFSFATAHPAATLPTSVHGLPFEGRSRYSPHVVASLLESSSLPVEPISAAVVGTGFSLLLSWRSRSYGPISLHPPKSFAAKSAIPLKFYSCRSRAEWRIVWPASPKSSSPPRTKSSFASKGKLRVNQGMFSSGSSFGCNVGSAVDLGYLCFARAPICRNWIQCRQCGDGALLLLLHLAGSVDRRVDSVKRSTLPPATALAGAFRLLTGSLLCLPRKKIQRD